MSKIGNNKMHTVVNGYEFTDRKAFGKTCKHGRSKLEKIWSKLVRNKVKRGSFDGVNLHDVKREYNEIDELALAI